MSLPSFLVQILANLVMETLHSDLRDTIGPRLKGKMQQKQRSWMLVSSPGGSTRTKEFENVAERFLPADFQCGVQTGVVSHHRAVQRAGGSMRSQESPAGRQLAN